MVCHGPLARLGAICGVSGRGSALSLMDVHERSILAQMCGTSAGCTRGRSTRSDSLHEWKGMLQRRLRDDRDGRRLAAIRPSVRKRTNRPKSSPDSVLRFFEEIRGQTLGALRRQTCVRARAIVRVHPPMTVSRRLASPYRHRQLPNDTLRSTRIRRDSSTSAAFQGPSQPSHGSSFVTDNVCLSGSVVASLLSRIAIKERRLQPFPSAPSPLPRARSGCVQSDRRRV